jgi:hypothetical protein
MKPKRIGHYARIAAIAPFVIAMSAAPSFAAERFTAKLQPMNADKIGTSTTGTATFEIADGKLSIAIDLAGLPPNMMHLQHFHGFPDGKAASCPTGAADTNGDGYIDLVETEPFAGTTMMPFHAHPVTLEIANDSYPVADKNGVSHYTDTVSVADLDAALKAKFKAPSLALDKRVIFIHGVANSPALPTSVKSLPGVPANVTIPIACGKIEAVK